MKKLSKISGFFLVLFLLSASISYGQFRDQETKNSDFTGNVIKQNPAEGANFSNLFNMQMSHSYSMTFASFGGQYQSLNAYTNTMNFFFTDKLTGEVAFSLLHSPFGNSVMNNQGTLGTEFILRNAELNYQFGDKSNISIHFSQVPSYGFGPGYYSPFYRNSYFDQY
ncbi:MAG: hypothetical protein U5J95_07450 [Balneolaceae bacterium]|nr:hypothetical protein [Balneolaceae bacterium]